MSLQDRFRNLPTDAAAQPSRRDVLSASLLAGGGLLLGISSLPGEAAVVVTNDRSDNLDFGAFLQIGTDNTVRVIAKHDEMGQGIFTGLAMVVCEELEVAVDKVEVVPAPANPAYAHTVFGLQITGGSSSTYSSFAQMQQAGASARMLLMQAAADRWGISTDQCEARDGVIHRKGGSESLTYGSLAADAAKLPTPTEVPLKQPNQFKKIGRPTKRIDSGSKVRGTAPFGLDHYVDGMLTALIARCPYFGGSLKNLNDSKARAVRGVRAVVEVPAGVAVVADNYWSASKGRDALEIDWNPGPGQVMDTQRLRREYHDRARRTGLAAETVGKPEETLASAVRRLDAVYEVPYQAHAPMEPLSCLVTLQADGSAELVTGSQMLGADHPAVAARLGVAPEKVTLRNTYLGGGFGRRANPASDFLIDAVDVALAARSLKAPIKTIWSREDDIRGGWYRPMFVNAMSAAIDGGDVTAWRHRIVGQSILAGTPFEPFMVRHGIDEMSVEGATKLPYQVPNRSVELHTVRLPVPVQWWRSVGHSNTAFAKESFLDEVAEALGRDPLELRREMLVEQPRLLRVLEEVADVADWSKPAPTGVGRGISVHFSFESYAAHVVEASIVDGRPKIHRIVCGIDCGPVVNPDQVEAQMQSAALFALSAVLEGEITFENGRVVQSNFDDFKVVRMHEAPQIDVHIVESTEKMGGVGEVGVPGIASAVCSALRAAGGPRIRRLPIGDQLY